MLDIAISVENLGKQYTIGRQQEGYSTLRDTLTKSLKGMFDLFHKNKMEKETIWAVKNINFEVKQGEVLGIIGRNGAGKTTLLKILSRITEPSEGRVRLRGRVGSLLEVGTGFHPELTGRENIYLNGAILGMKKAEIEHKFDEIVAFAEVEKFLDTQVKFYSSGMYMRLAFSVAAHLEPEILLVDEVLAVGDASFQKKCLGKMGNVAKEGRTVLFVSHNMGAIDRLCRKTVLLDQGEIVLGGQTREVIRRYQSETLTNKSEWKRQDALHTSPDVEFISVHAKDQYGKFCGVFSGNEPIHIEIEYIVKHPLSSCQIDARLHNSEGIPLFTVSDCDEHGVSALPRLPGTYLSSFVIAGNWLAPGRYSLLIGAHLPGHTIYEVIENTIVFEVTQDGSCGSLDNRVGLLAPLIPWQTRKVDT